MMRAKKIFWIIALIALAGCTSMDFNYAAERINALNAKYNTTMETFPTSIDKINQMIADYEGLKSIRLSAGKEQLDYSIDFRLLNLEAAKLFIEGNKYGNAGYTKNGFGCKLRPLIVESFKLRNESAQKGYGSAGLLMKFTEKYPDDSKKLGLSMKTALFMNATFLKVYEEAVRDSQTINGFCPESKTLELYKQEFSKGTVMSKSEIDNLKYDEAAKIWKEKKGYK